MFDFHEKRKIRALIYSKIVIVGIIIVGFFIAQSAYERYTVEREMAEKRDAKIVELQHIQERYDGLESEISRLRNERGIEEELRNRFDAIREGEEIVVILEDATLEAAASEARSRPQIEEPPRSFWQKIVDVFGFGS